MGKATNNTLEIVNAVIKIELYEERATRTQTEPIPTQPVIA